jgi:hypothetical protein
MLISIKPWVTLFCSFPSHHNKVNVRKYFLEMGFDPSCEITYRISYKSSFSHAEPDSFQGRRFLFEMGQEFREKLHSAEGIITAFLNAHAN